MKINQFKNKLRKNITSFKIGGTYNIQNKTKKTSTQTYQKKYYLQVKLNET